LRLCPKDSYGANFAALCETCFDEMKKIIYNITPGRKDSLRIQQDLAALQTLLLCVKPVLMK
jgi:hypothetical protein